MATALATGMALTFGALALAGCGNDQSSDLKNVKFRDPQKAEGYNNVDGHPNVVRFCVDGRAFVSTTRPGDGLMRMPEWDSSFCGIVK
jgi:hypothetical protein